MTELERAIEVVKTAFNGRLDKGDKPYYLHCLHVMNTIHSTEEDVKIAAVMHDLIEDTDYTFGDITRLGFSDKVVRILHLVTHDKVNTTYDDYIKAISVDKDATDIKLADLRHNSDITRMKGLRKKDLDRLEKYHRHYMYLSEIYEY